jgi:hypothetical protein
LIELVGDAVERLGAGRSLTLDGVVGPDCGILPIQPDPVLEARLTVYTDYALRMLMYLALRKDQLATIAEALACLLAQTPRYRCRTSGCALIS